MTAHQEEGPGKLAASTSATMYPRTMTALRIARPRGSLVVGREALGSPSLPATTGTIPRHGWVTPSPDASANGTSRAVARRVASP